MDQGGEIIEGVPQPVAWGVDHRAGLAHPVAPGNVLFPGELLGQGVAVQDGPLGRPHFEGSGRPGPGGLQGLPGPPLLGVPCLQGVHRLLRPGQRPEDQDGVGLLGQLGSQGLQTGSVLGEQDLPPFFQVFSDFFHPIHAGSSVKILSLWAPVSEKKGAAAPLTFAWFCGILKVLCSRDA